MTSLVRLLLALAVILSVGWVVGLVFRRFRQPAVIGEVFAGILLGPSLFGRLAPDLMKNIFTPSVLIGLSSIANVGLIFYMFSVGMALDLRSVSNRVHAAVGISHASILLPALLGGGLAFALYPGFAPEGVRFLPFALFLALAMSITAFPVLARLLADLGMTHSPVGAVALACAAVDDVTAWCLLALVVALSGAAGGTLLLTFGGALAFIAVSFWGVRPLMGRWLGSIESGDRKQELSVMGPLAAVVVAASTATEWIGIHALFGAFCVGACMPRNPALLERVEDRLSGLLHAVLLPVVFALSGLRTEVGLLRGGTEWLILCAVVTLACAGKLGGTLVAGRLSGMGWRQATAVGLLMNTRGLMELIVLNVGLDLGVLTPTLFTIFVLMALVTTVMAAPLFRWLTRSEPFAFSAGAVASSTVSPTLEG